MNVKLCLSQQTDLVVTFPVAKVEAWWGVCGRKLVQKTQTSERTEKQEHQHQVTPNLFPTETSQFGYSLVLKIIEKY